MNQEKMGKFISELRKTKGLTQYEFAELIPISRDAVSKWEQGKRCPEPECLVKLSEIFDISINELLFGEKQTKNNRNDIADVSIKLYEDRNKKQKKLKILISVIIVLIVCFLTYYFINTYNSLKVYLVSYDSENLKIQNGVLVMTNEKLYFNLGDISSDSEIKFVELFYKDKQNNEKLIIRTEDLNIIFNDFEGYNEYVNFDNINFVINNLYLKVVYADDEDIIKLNVNKHFSNDYLFSKSKIESSNEKIDFDNTIYEVEEKIKSTYECLDNFCIGNYKDYEIIYVIDARTLSINSISERNNYEWIYNFGNENLIFQEYNNTNEVINKFTKSKDNNFCEIGNCKNIENEITIFDEIINSIIKDN